MLIDWFTVGAQVLNFLILVWLLKRFLYKPILTAIDAREKRIAGDLAAAAATKVAAAKERDDLLAKSKAFDEQRDARLAKVRADANVEKERLFDEARKAANELRTKQTNALQSERAHLDHAIGRIASEEVFAILRKSLGALADVSLEERIVEVFIRRLRDLDANAKAALGEALKKLSGPAVVRSAFDLPAEQRATLQKAIDDTFSMQIAIRFETGSNLLCGIELTANGQKLAWSLGDYLKSLQSKVDALLDPHATPAPTPVSAHPMPAPTVHAEAT